MTPRDSSTAPGGFSRDVLAAATGVAVYAWGPSLGWSDLGTPDRLQRWLHDLAQMPFDAGAQTRHLGSRRAG